MKIKSNKKKLAEGGVPYGDIAQMGSQVINTVDGMDGKPSYAGGIMSGAMSGASMGAALGPWGMAAGAVVGGGLALFQAEQKKKEEAKAKELYNKNLDEQAARTSQQTLRNYATQGITSAGHYAYGGNVTPEYEVERGEVVQGQPMLEEGQQVASDMHLVGGERHENGGTDGMGGQRVFSDRLKTGGKTYAHHAEKLGKQKGKYEEKLSSYNEASKNTGERMIERIDTKLDELFNEQEMKKYANMPSSFSSSKPKMWNGGDIQPVLNIDGKPLYYDDVNRRGMYGTYEDAVKNGTRYRAGQPGNKYPYPTLLGQDGRWYAHNDSIEPLTPKNVLTNTAKFAAPTTLPYLNVENQATNVLSNSSGNNTTNKGNNIPWQYADNLINGIMTANTPEIAKPYLDPAVRLNTTFDINPQLSSAKNTRDALAKSMDYSTVHSGVSNANKQKLFATYNENANALYAQKHNVENDLKNKEILLNSNINSRNNDKRYAYDVQNTQRRAGIQSDYAQNASNFALDQYTSNRDAKMDARDLEHIKIIAMANPNTADYGYKLDSIKRMYASDPTGLKRTIDKMRLTTPNSPALVELETYYNTLSK